MLLAEWLVKVCLPTVIGHLLSALIGLFLLRLNPLSFCCVLLRTFSHSLRELDYQPHKPGSLASTSQHFGEEKPRIWSLETRWRQCRNKREFWYQISQWGAMFTFSVLQVWRLLISKCTKIDDWKQFYTRVLNLKVQGLPPSYYLCQNDIPTSLERRLAVAIPNALEIKI